MKSGKLPDRIFYNWKTHYPGKHDILQMVCIIGMILGHQRLSSTGILIFISPPNKWITDFNQT